MQAQTSSAAVMWSFRSTFSILGSAGTHSHQHTPKTEESISAHTHTYNCTPITFVFSGFVTGTRMCARVLCLTPSSPRLSLSHGPITVLIEASSALGAAPVILASEMYNDVHSIPAGGSRGDSAPLKIQCLVMQGTIRQSSSLPCDTGNTINVALTLNRPLALACLPSITITGLFGVSYDPLMHNAHARTHARIHKNTQILAEIS